ncbi:hypothetical protein pdam_00011916 [Pocillopora damicornis]|uniref:Uncharacterized protein n=1 Tax=Pocillopora damicornis TaxID=46731 RepID=A0A3M6TZX7_POCDA|nr:hypothetical protein pdam_00011916 [Pocillopora damicornis]
MESKDWSVFGYFSPDLEKIKQLLNADSSEESGQTSRQIPHSYECPFKWDRDDDPARLPRFMTKAVCRDCKHYCLPVHYSQKGLVRKCDVTTGEVVWKWITVELPVAFVYNAYSGVNFIELRSNYRLFAGVFVQSLPFIRITLDFIARISGGNWFTGQNNIVSFKIIHKLLRERNHPASNSDVFELWIPNRKVAIQHVFPFHFLVGS